MHYITFETEDYSNWLRTQTLKSRRQIQDRISKIEVNGYFGHHKYLEDEDLWELKFNDGRRIYYVIVQNTNVFITRRK